MSNKKFIIAAAGAGKTTFIVKEALKQSGNVLITTYTEANEAEIKKKIIKLNKVIPANITVQTWFSFLIQHGAKPYQGCLTQKDITGLQLVNEKSGLRYKTNKGIPIYYSEDEFFENHYFTQDGRIYSDKLSKFVVRCNSKSCDNVIDRISRIYSHIFVDEVQDLAGYDLDIIKLFFQSKSNVILVGDPRQVTYLTHHEQRHSKYKDGKIEEFILANCKGLTYEIDKSTLKSSHRNCEEICSFSSRLYPTYPSTKACSCPECRQLQMGTKHIGIYIIKSEKVNEYIHIYNPTVLRYKEAKGTEWNFGKAKGLGFDRVLIYPTKGFTQFLKDGSLLKTKNGKLTEAFDVSKLYVAITRARHSVAIVHDYSDNEVFIDGVNKFDTIKLQ